MATKPSIPKGTRDFSPVEMLRRQYIFDTIRGVFRKYGFLPLETPAMENLETLTGKYGEEGDRLIFKVLNSGDWTAGLTRDEVIVEIQEAIENQVGDGEDIELSEAVAKFLRTSIRTYLKTRDVSEKALRYDLTVPFARYVVMHQHELAFPFKRYQIQPVWRADRPQKGRYREFYQCDADVIGSTSLLNEVELVQIFDDVFALLDLQVVVKVNNRKVLQGIAEYCGCPGKLGVIAVAIDKVEKIGVEAVRAELLAEGIDTKGVDDIFSCLFPDTSSYVDFADTDDAVSRGYSEQEARLIMSMQSSSMRAELEKLDCLCSWFSSGPEKLDQSRFSLTGVVGCKEMIQVFGIMSLSKQSSVRIEYDPSLARGLDYYTGAIFEVKASEGSMPGSICGGGRYDDLTGVFGLKNMSGVGISFGADRIYDVLLETDKFPAELGGSTKLLFANFGEAEALHCLKLLRQVREAGIAAELYPDAVKMAKQFKYADDKGIAFVAMIGENELKQGIVTVKDMKTGEQKAVNQQDLIHAIQEAQGQ